MKTVDPTFTLEQLKAVVTYDPDTGIFRHARNNGPARIGKEVGKSGPMGYRRVNLLGRHVYVHRLAWFYVYGVWPREIDHINQNKQDNGIANLRDISHSENMANRKRWRTTHPVKGVKLTKHSTHQVSISVHGRPKYVGTFKTLAEADDAFQRAVEVRRQTVYEPIRQTTPKPLTSPETTPPR